MSEDTAIYDADPFAGMDVTIDERAALVEKLVHIRALKDQLATLKRQIEENESPVRAWLEAHPGEVLVDLERGITAELREKNKPAEVDLISAAKHPENEALIAEAARMGLLSARLTPLRAQRGASAAADMLLRFETPGGATHELRIERQR